MTPLWWAGLDDVGVDPGGFVDPTLAAGLIDPTLAGGLIDPTLAAGLIDPMLGFAEPIASWLHLAGAAAVLALGPSLVRSGKDSRARASLAVFAGSVVFLLAVSGTYHLLDQESAARAVFRRLDHAAIWVLIAGTFTPIHVIMLRGFMRSGMLAIVWACAIAALTTKTILFASVPEGLSFGLYVFVGWLGAISVTAFARLYGLRSAMPVLWGGLVYTAGATIWLVEPPALIPGYVGYHEVFHVAVLVGIAMHWRFIAREVAGVGATNQSTASSVGILAAASSRSP